jgi:succinoglycan biosynthesis protein ExoA
LWAAKRDGFVGQVIAVAFQSPFAAGGTQGHDPSYAGPVDLVYLGCWPRRVFDQIGLFDEKLMRYQDDEFNLRQKAIEAFQYPAQDG